MLVAAEPPLVTVLDGGGGVRTDVAPALALGEEHPSFPCDLGIEAPQSRHQLVADGIGGVALDDVCGGAGHPEAAVHGGLGLVDDVGDRGGEGGRDRAPAVGLEGDESVRTRSALVSVQVELWTISSTSYPHLS